MTKKTKPITEQDISSSCHDWKDDPEEVTTDVLTAINDLLKIHPGCSKIYKYDDPLTEGSDTCGYIYSVTELSKKQLKKLSKKIWGC